MQGLRWSDLFSASVLGFSCSPQISYHVFSLFPDFLSAFSFVLLFFLLLSLTLSSQPCIIIKASIYYYSFFKFMSKISFIKWKFNTQGCHHCQSSPLDWPDKTTVTIVSLYPLQPKMLTLNFDSSNEKPGTMCPPSSGISGRIWTHWI